MPNSSKKQKILASFQFKLFIVFTLLTAIATTVLSLLYISSEIKEKRLHAAENAELLARQLAVSVRLPLYAENAGMLQQIVEEAVKAPEIQRVVVSNVAGRILAQCGAPSSGAGDILVKTIEVRSDSKTLSAESAITAETSGVDSLIGYVRLERDLKSLKNLIRDVVIKVTGVAIFFWLSVTLLCFIVLRQVTRSFNALVAGVEKMRQGDYDSRIDIVCRDEAGRVGISINQLAETLRQREDENKRLHSELVLAEQVARDSEKSIKNLLNGLPVGIIWSDKDSGIEYLNHFMAERFDLEIGHVCTVIEWLPLVIPDEDELKKVIQSRNAAIACEECQNCTDINTVEARMTARDGSLCNIILSNRIINGKIIDLLVDVTERELLQNQLVRLAKLESLGILGAGIAHNFNNVLTGVIGYITYAQKFLEQPHKAYEPLGLAVSASQRASELARQLMAFARGGPPDKKPLNVEKIVLESTLLAVIGTQIHHTLEAAPSVHLVNADASQLNQAFSCIAINAVQAMPTGGRLDIKIGNCRHEADNILGLPSGDYVEVSFEDNGCGIPEENWKNIFVPYFTTKSNVGSGLGLATTHTIISGHGGAITFKSMAGVGTKFTIYLPALLTGEEQSA